MTRLRRLVFPFSAIVGQDKMKKALLLNAINPKIGGVLIRGQKGTGKSTAVRALAELLPEIEVVADCSFNCNPKNPAEMCDICYERYANGESLPVVKRKVRIVDLPLNATVDRVVGTLDIKRALKEGIKALEPGLLAEANRGILYIDEVNLLDDYVADVLLDAAASGVNIIEREGVSVSHPSKFILVGTMNPEEGELRPQLLDRFGLQVDVEPITDPDLQIEIIKRVEEFSEDQEGFIKKYEGEQEELRKKIALAQELLPKVSISDDLLHLIAQACSELAVSNRAGIVVARTAKTIAAFNGRLEVAEEDVREAMELALPHRMRKKPFEPPKLPSEQIRKVVEQHRSINQQLQSEPQNNSSKLETPSKEQVFPIGQPPPLSHNSNRRRVLSNSNHRSGRSLRIRTNDGRGAYVYATIPRESPRDVAIDATIRAAALRALMEKKSTIEIEGCDLREKVRHRRASNLVVFVVDASGSMAAMRRMEAAKGAVLELLNKAYVDRDRVAFIAFRGYDAKLLLPPTNSVELAAKELENLPTGGRTPLSDGLFKALEVVKRERRAKKYARPIVVLVTDGKANVPLGYGTSIKEEVSSLSRALHEEGAEVVVIDTLPLSHRALPYAPTYTWDIVKASDARYLRLPEVTAEELYKVVTDLHGWR